MLPYRHECDTHDTYVLKVKNAVRVFYSQGNALKAKEQELLCLLLSSDYTPVYDIVEKKYGSEGRKAKDPACMFRALIYAGYMDINNPKDLAAELEVPLIAVICGFNPYADKHHFTFPPGEATFYDFFTRNWELSKPNLLLSNVRERHVRPALPAVAGDKAPSVEKETCAAAIVRIRKKVFHLENEGYGILLSIFCKLGLDRSIELGLIDPSNVAAGGDGTPYVTATRERSHTYCPENEAGGFRCACVDKKCRTDCPYRNKEQPDALLPCQTEEAKEKRYYMQPDSDTGWNSSLKRYYVGRNLYALTDTHSGLILFFHLFPASKHDSHAFAETYARCCAYIPYLHFTELCLDSANDNIDTYAWMYDENIDVFIDINNRSQDEVRLPAKFRLNDDNIPICPGDRQMVKLKVDAKSERMVFVCPALRKTAEGITCCCDCAGCKKGSATTRITVPLSLLKGDAAKAPVKLPLGFSSEMKENGDLGVKCPESLDMRPIGKKGTAFRFGCPLTEVNSEGKRVCTCKTPCSKANAGRTLTASVAPTSPDGGHKESEDECVGTYRLNNDGRPKCKAGLFMEPNGSNHERGLVMFRCPLMEKDADGNVVCTCPTPCSDAKYGKNVCIPRTEDLRRLNIPQRGTEAWKLHYNLRTACERLNKRLKEDFNLEDRTCHNTKMCYVQTYTLAILQHQIEHVKVIREQHPELDPIPALVRELGVTQWHSPGGFTVCLK